MGAKNTTRNLKRRHARALKRVSKETRLLNACKQRRFYWISVASSIESRLEQLRDGQLEMQFN